MDNIQIREIFFRAASTKKLVVFGTGGMSDKVCGILKFEVEYFLDSDKNKAGKRFFNRYIREPSSVLKEDIENIIVLVASMYYDDILDMLIGFGFIENHNVFDCREVFYYELKKTGKVCFESELMPLSEHLSLAFTFNCSAKCPHCLFVQQNYKFAQNKFITSDFLIKILESDKAKEVKKVTCGGGEALLHPDFFQLVKIIKSFKIPFIEVFTNGLVLQSDKIAKGLIEQEELSHIHISLDSVSEEDYNKARGIKKSDFFKIIQNIRNIANGLKGKNTRIGVSFIISEEKYSDIKEMISFTSELNVDYCHFTTLHIVDANSADNTCDLYSSLPVAFKELFNGCNTYDFDIIIQPPIMDEYSRYYCDSLAEHLCISPEGIIAPCCHIPWDTIYGSFFESSDNPMNNRSSVEMREKFIQAYRTQNVKLLPEQCRLCNRRLIGRYILNKGTTDWKFV